MPDTTPGERVWAIEGSASFGRGLTVAFSRAGEWVIEFDWARHKAAKDAAKSDGLECTKLTMRASAQGDR